LSTVSYKGRSVIVDVGLIGGATAHRETCRSNEHPST